MKKNTSSLGQKCNFASLYSNYSLSCPLINNAYMFYNHVKQKKKRSRQKKLKAYDLSTLSECLPELKSPTPSEPAELKINCKRRNGLV